MTAKTYRITWPLDGYGTVQFYVVAADKISAGMLSHSIMHRGCHMTTATHIVEEVKDTEASDMIKRGVYR